MIIVKFQDYTALDKVTKVARICFQPQMMIMMMIKMILIMFMMMIISNDSDESLMMIQDATSRGI